MAAQPLCSDQRWCLTPVITRRRSPKATGAFTTFVSGSPTRCLPATYSRSTARDSAKCSLRSLAKGARQQDAVRPVATGRAGGQDVVGPLAGVRHELPGRDGGAVESIACRKASQRTPVGGPVSGRCQKIPAVSQAN